MKTVLRNSIIVVLFNLLLLFLLIVIVTSCHKSAAKETVLPDMIITEIKGSTWNGDSLSSCTPQYIGYFLGNNNLVITGKNFGNSIGEVSVNLPEFIEANIVEWKDNIIILKTDCDEYKKFNTDVKFTIVRGDEKKIDFSKKMVTDIEGYIANSPTWFMFYYYMSVFKKSILDEFIDNMDLVEVDYMPQKYDILRDKNGLKVINSTPSVSANGVQRKYTYETIRMSCDEKTVTKVETFTVLNDAIVETSDTPTAYYRE